MKMFGFLCFMLSAGSQLQAGVTPVQKVIQMMQEMKAKGVAEKDKEIQLYKEYMSWCKDTATDKKHEIITATDTIERNEAKIRSNTAAAVDLTDKVAAIDADIATWTQDKAAATEIREKEAADYKTTNDDYSASIDALERAIVALSKSQGTIAQATELIQTIAAEHRVPASARALMQTMLDDEDEQRPTAPEAAGYVSQSGGIVKVMEDLKEKFEEERAALQKKEMEDKHAFDMLELELADQIAYGTKERDGKAAKASEHKATVGEAKGTLSEAKTEKEEAETYLSDMTAQCELKSEAFEGRQKMRAEELVAIDKAIEIISGEAVKGSAEKHLPTLVQSFVHLRSAAHAPSQARAAELLRKRAKQLGSDRLSLLAVKVEADPFAKVINMIKDLIAKLKEEAGAEAEHKAWCDEELKQNKLTRDAKTAEVAELTAKVDQINAAIAKLVADTEAHLAAIAELDRMTAEATEVRQKEKAKNEETIADAKAALEAVSMAMKVLKEFYAKAGGEEALMQQSPADDAPESFSNDAYTGQQGAKGGVVGMMEVIHSDFSRLEADTSADEAQAASEYEQLMEESKKDRETKRLATVQWGRDKSAKERDLEATTTDQMQAQEELDAALSYHDKLKPDCIEEGLSFEERAKMRQEEIDSLNEAYDILDGMGK
jgi:hypothetical protein